jgi:hypothetical protein
LKLISDTMGTGQKIRGEIPNSPDYKERIEFGEIIGMYSRKEGEIIIKTPTTKV